MTNKLIRMMFVTVLVLGLTFAGCNPDSNDDGNDVEKKITITGLDGRSGPFRIKLEGNEGSFIATGDEYISGNSVTIALTKNEGGAWTGNGSCYIFAFFLNEPSDNNYVYTNGQTLAELGGLTPPTLYQKLPKYSITEEVTSIDFNKFVKLEYYTVP